MNTAKIELNPDELSLLIALVESSLDETRVELHRTHFSPSFRDNVKDEAALLRGLLERLQQLAPKA